jgi:hypothetical protein
MKENKGRKSKKRQTKTGQRRSRRQRRTPRRDRHEAVTKQARQRVERGANGSVMEPHRDHRSIVMMVFAFASIAMAFMLYAFAFITKDATMMRQLMTIVEIGLAATLGWAGGTGLLQFVTKFHV